MKNKDAEMPDELNYTTSVESSVAVMKAINETLFLERMKPLMTAVAKELVKAGVDFSKVKTVGRVETSQALHVAEKSVVSAPHK